jgi:hypothetical protein
MLKQASHETVMDCLGRRMSGEDVEKIAVIRKEAPEQLAEIRVLHRLNVPHELAVHDLAVLLRDREIVRRDILTGIGFADLLQGGLKRAVEVADTAGDVYIVKGFKFVDRVGIGIPDLRVNDACPVLQNNVLVILAVLGHCRLLVLAEVDVLNAPALSELTDVSHKFSVSIWNRASFTPAHNCRIFKYLKNILPVK